MLEDYFTHTDLSEVSSFFISDSFVSGMKCDTRGKSPRILSCGIEYFSKSDEDKDIFEKIKQLGHRCSISLKGTCTTVAFENSLIKEMILPQMELSLTEDVVFLEMGKNIPFDVNDVFYDFIATPLEESDQLRILLGVVPKKVYQSILQRLDSYGLSFPKLPFRESLIGIYYHYESDIFKTETVMLMDVSSQGTLKFFFYEKGHLRFCKTILAPEGIFEWNLDSSQKFWNNFCSQVEKSVTYFKRFQKGERPQYLKIHSLRDISSDLLQTLCKTLQMKNFSFKCSVEREYILPFAYAISVLKAKALLWAKERKKKEHPLILFFSPVMIFLCSLIFFESAFLLTAYKKWKTVRVLDRHYRTLKKESKDLKTIIARFKNLSAFANKALIYRRHRYATLALLENLLRYLPSGSSVFSFQKNSSGEVCLKGISKRFSNLKQSLELCPFIHDVRIFRLDSEKDDLQEGVSFECHFYFGKLTIEESHGQR